MTAPIRASRSMFSRCRTENGVSRGTKSACAAFEHHVGRLSIRWSLIPGGHCSQRTGSTWADDHHGIRRAGPEAIGANHSSRPNTRNCPSDAPSQPLSKSATSRGGMAGEPHFLSHMIWRLENTTARPGILPPAGIPATEWYRAFPTHRSKPRQWFAPRPHPLLAWVWQLPSIVIVPLAIAMPRVHTLSSGSSDKLRITHAEWSTPQPPGGL